MPKFSRSLWSPYSKFQIKLDSARKDILSKLNEYSGTTPEEAKLSFLNEVHKLETFGSAFFEVRQTTDHSLPQKILVAIMKRGIIIIDPTSKEPNFKYILPRAPQYVDARILSPSFPS